MIENEVSYQSTFKKVFVFDQWPIRINKYWKRYQVFNSWYQKTFLHFSKVTDIFSNGKAHLSSFPNSVLMNVMMGQKKWIFFASGLEPGFLWHRVKFRFCSNPALVIQAKPSPRNKTYKRKKFNSTLSIFSIFNKIYGCWEIYHISFLNLLALWRELVFFFTCLLRH